MPLRFPTQTSRETVGRFGIFDVERHGIEVEGREGYSVHVLRCFEWVCAVAVAEDGRFILVRQHRYGINRLTLEPAGGIIDPGEDPEAAAIRELREETGHAGTFVEPLGVVHPNPAFQDNRCFMFLVRGAREVGPLELDEREVVERVMMDRAKVRAAIADGRISHALAVLALERAFARLDGQ